jgi:chromosome segregation ATPase
LLVKEGPGGINERSIAALEKTNRLLELQLEQRRSEHRINESRCEQLVAPNGAIFRLEESLAEFGLRAKELALNSSMLERELEAVQADTLRLRRESQAVAMLEQAHHNLHARTRSEEEIVTQQLKEKEAERNVHRELLETTAQHYHRAVQGQSRAQLKVESLLAETKAVLSVSAHHKKRVEQLDVAIAEQTQRRRQTEQRLAHCRDTLEGALGKFQVCSLLSSLFSLLSSLARRSLTLWI